MHSDQREIVYINFVHLGVGLQRLREPDLRSRPLIIAPATARALVLDMSPEARRAGVRRGMRLAVARSRCPEAAVRPPQRQEYQKLVNRCLRAGLAFTPLVAPGRGTGHLYLDISGSRRLLGPAVDVARKVRQELVRITGLRPAWTLATSRLVARTASRLVKPDGTYVVVPGTEAAFLAPLPLSLLPGITPQELARLRELNIRTVVQARQLSRQDLALLCGSRAPLLHRMLRGIDPRPVHPCPVSAPPGLEYRCSFSPDTNHEQTVIAGLHSLVLQAGHRLRARGLGCRRVAVRLVYSDGVEVVRQAAARGVAADNQTIRQLAVTALYRGWHRRVRLQSLSLSCSRLLTPAVQLSLFACNEKAGKNIEISRAVDVIRERFGALGIRPASLLPAQQRYEIDTSRR